AESSQRCLSVLIMSKEFIESVLAGVQILSLLALIIYVIKTWHMASAALKSATVAEQTLQELKDARDQETAPQVVAYFDVPRRRRTIDLVIKNIGKTTAHNVKLKFDPVLKSSIEQVQIEDLVLFKEGIGSMPPGYEIRTVFDSVISYFRSD